jgi:hypothetical protein
LNLSWYCWFHFFIYCLHRFRLPAVVPLSSYTVTRERFIAVLALLTFLVSSFDPIGVIVLFTSTLSRLELLCWVEFSLDRVDPCIHRCRFSVPLALPSSLLWVLPTSHNTLLRLSRKVIPRLPRIFSTESVDPETCRVCFQFQGGCYETSLGRIREHFQPSRPWSPRQSLFCLSFCLVTEHRILSRPLLVHLLFRAVAADTGTPHSISRYCTSLLFMREQLRMVGFSPRRTWCRYHFFYVLLFVLSLLCFEARVTVRYTPYDVRGLYIAFLGIYWIIPCYIRMYYQYLRH